MGDLTAINISNQKSATLDALHSSSSSSSRKKGRRTEAELALVYAEKAKKLMDKELKKRLAAKAKADRKKARAEKRKMKEEREARLDKKKKEEEELAAERAAIDEKRKAGRALGANNEEDEEEERKRKAEKMHSIVFGLRKKFEEDPVERALGFSRWGVYLQNELPRAIKESTISANEQLSGTTRRAISVDAVPTSTASGDNERDESTHHYDSGCHISYSSSSSPLSCFSSSSSRQLADMLHPSANSTKGTAWIEEYKAFRMMLREEVEQHEQEHQKWMRDFQEQANARHKRLMHVYQRQLDLLDQQIEYYKKGPESNVVLLLEH
ncbi:hypothetical protein HDV05_007851 [Chytridiales sp. JEL 0842]|nr:hypothetical protein HDV05_007851 [Chytridiales sp. JEL 0842]